MKNTKLAILDIDNCLIYASYKPIENLLLVDRKTWFYLYHRPGVKKFLEKIQEIADVIFYTSAKKTYAQWILKTLDMDREIPLFTRKNCQKKYTEFGEVYYKSLSKLKLSKKYEEIIVVDDRIDLWDDKGVTLYSIEPFLGQPDDQELSKLIEIIQKA
jgi:TFIIF-interacting CTD phosphatase-like protein